MHVAIVGAGSLGSVFGVRLACGPDPVRVSFVVRPHRGAPPSGSAPPMVIEQIDGSKGTLSLDAPIRVTAVPDDADVIIVCVRFEQLDERLAALLARSRAPVVTMTPLFPQSYAFLEGVLGGGEARLFPGMPGIVAYDRDGIGRYWLPRVATTLIEQPKDARPAIEALAGALDGAGIPCRVQPAVHATNMATTFTFVPVMMGIDVAGSIDALLDDVPTLGVVLRAADEARRLARDYGKPAIWADWFVRFTSRSLLKIGIAFARRRSPEGIAYVEEHFGSKLRAQNLQMAELMVELFRERGHPHEAMAELRDRLRAAPLAAEGR